MPVIHLTSRNVGHPGASFQMTTPEGFPIGPRLSVKGALDLLDALERELDLHARGLNRGIVGNIDAIQERGANA